MPGMKPTGTNTDSNTSVIATIGAVISFIASFTASGTESVVSSSLCSTLSTTTIASSTTMPMARIIANIEIVFAENPIARQDGERADQRHRHGDHGDERGANVAEEQKDDENDEDECLDQRVDDFLHRILDEYGRIVRDFIVDALGKPLLEGCHRFTQLFRGRHRVASG